ARTIPASRLILRSRDTAPAAVAEVLGTEACIRIDRLRLLRNDPILSEEIWLPADRFDGIETVPEAEIGPLLYPFYLERHGVFIATADDEVSFGTATPLVAARLGLAEGDPVALIERTAFAVDGTAMEWRRATGPAHRFRYRSRIG
ncbi:UTRA domain-containing protein, partial [Thioclava sp. BHET1]